MAKRTGVATVRQHLGHLPNGAVLRGEQQLADLLHHHALLTRPAALLLSRHIRRRVHPETPLLHIVQTTQQQYGRAVPYTGGGVLGNFFGSVAKGLRGAVSAVSDYANRPSMNNTSKEAIRVGAQALLNSARKGDWRGALPAAYSAVATAMRPAMQARPLFLMGGEE